MSSQRQNYDDAVRRVAERLDFPDAAPDENGDIVLAFAETFVGISCNEPNGTASLYAFVRRIPGDCPAAVLRRLLEAQCFFRDTKGASVSLAAGQDCVLLHKELDLVTLDERILDRTVTDLMTTAANLHREITAMLEDRTGGAEPDGDGMDAASMLSMNMISI